MQAKYEEQTVVLRPHAYSYWIEAMLKAGATESADQKLFKGYLFTHMFYSWPLHCVMICS